MLAVKALRSKLVRLSTEHSHGTARPQVLTFERWLARWSLRQPSMGHSEPIIPADGHEDEGLVWDLERSMSSDAAYAVSAALTKAAASAFAKLMDTAPGIDQVLERIDSATRSICKLAATASRDTSSPAMRELATAADELRTIALQGVAAAEAMENGIGASPSSSSTSIHVSAARQRGYLDISLNGTKPYLSITAAHYAKMQRLHQRHGGESSHEDVFHCRLWCCLARYEALKGAGYQCAVPGAAFDAVRPSLGETIECFASPLNCRYERFCSAFGPLESHFGSLGSFFEFQPRHGSFEANPPFVPEVMDAMVAHIERLLRDVTRGPLSFLVVVPAWGHGVRTCRDLEGSKFRRAAGRLAASDHSFCDGAQHVKAHSSDRHRPSSWDTAVVLLQNDVGADRWPLDDAGLANGFLAAMCNARPKGSPSLQEWENRGPLRGGKRHR